MLFYLLGDIQADSAQTTLKLAGFLEDLLSSNRAGAFSYNDDAKVPPATDASKKFLADAIDVIGNLWNQNHIRPACYPRLQRYPPAVASHDLYQHDPVVAFGGRMNLVDCFHGRLQ